MDLPGALFGQGIVFGFLALIIGLNATEAKPKAKCQLLLAMWIGIGLAAIMFSASFWTGLLVIE